MIYFKLCLFVETASSFSKADRKADRLYCLKLWCVSQVCSCIKSMPCVAYSSSCTSIYEKYIIYRNCLLGVLQDKTCANAKIFSFIPTLHEIPR